MPVTMITQERQQQVGKIDKATAEYVSIVRHAANRSGFRIIKSESDEPSMPVQSIMVPNDTTIENLASKPELSWLNDVKKDDVKDRGEYREYLQVPRDKFDDSTLKMKWVGDTKAFAVVGQLREGEKADLIAMPGMNDMANQYDACYGPFQNQIARPLPAFLFSEIDAFQSNARGILQQTELDPTDRNDGLWTSYEALGKFLRMAIDALGDLPSDTPLLLQKEDEQTSEGEFDMFKSKEEMAEFFSDVMDKKLVKAGLLKEDGTPVVQTFAPKVETSKIEDKGDSTELSEIKAMIQTLAENQKSSAAKQEELAEKQDKIAARLVTNSNKHDESPEQGDEEENYAEKMDEWMEQFPAGVPKEQRSGVFSGMLFSRKQ